MAEEDHRRRQSLHVYLNTYKDQFFITEEVFYYSVLAFAGHVLNFNVAGGELSEKSDISFNSASR